MNKQKINFILSSLSRIYGANLVNNKMKEFALTQSNYEIPFYESLIQFDKYIDEEFKNYLN